MNNSINNIYKQVSVNRNIYYMPRLLELPLKVERLGFIHNKTEVINRLFALPSVCFCISGTGIIEEDGKTRSLRAPFMLWNLIGDHKCYTPTENWDELYIGFAANDEAVLKKLFPQKLFYPRLKKLSHPDEILNIISRIIGIINGDLKEGDYDKIDMLAMELLLTALIPHKNEMSFEEDTLRKITVFMEHHCCEEIDLKRTAEKFGISYSTFQRYWKKIYPMPPREFLHKLKNAKAIELLSAPQYSICDTAALLGFKNQFYFSRFFHRMNGMSPREWRKFHQQQITTEHRL